MLRNAKGLLEEVNQADAAHVSSAMKKLKLGTRRKVSRRSR
jgi:hypothetical protein